MKRQSLLTVALATVMAGALLIPQLTVYANGEAESEPTTTTSPVFVDLSTTETIKEPAGTPNFTWYNKQSFEIQAGTNKTFQVMFQNLSKDFAYETKISLRSESNAITIRDTLVQEGFVSRMGIADFDMNVFVPKSTPAGRYSVDAVFTGTNADKVAFTQSLTFYIDVVNTLADKGVMISDYSVDVKEITPNKPFKLTLTLENTSGANISGLLLDIEGLDGSRFAMNDGLSLKRIDLKKGEKKNITYDLIATKGISSIREILIAKMTYQLDNKNAESKQETNTNITLTCKPNGNADGDDKVFAPNIIIDNYTFGNSFVIAGKTFPLNITIRNTSSTVNIENLKVTIQGASGSGSNGVAFSPANSSNSFFFNKLPVNASKNIEIDMLAKADAVPDSYPIEVTFDYEYTANGSKDKANPVTETLSIPLQQNDRFTANTPELPPDCMVGDEIPVSLTFINKGKSAVYNVTVDVEGEGFEKTSSAYYIGNVDSGTEEYYDTRIIPTMEGEVKGEIVVTYEDSNGNEKELRTAFTTMATAYNMPPMDGNGGYPGGEGMYPPDMQFDENGNPIDPAMGNKVTLPTWAIIAICAGGVVIVVVVIIVIVKLRSRKKLAAMLAAEAEDENENN